MTGHPGENSREGQSGQFELVNTPGQASLIRAEMTGLPEYDRKDRTAGTGQLRQDRTDSQERLVIRSACTSQPEGQSRMITQNIKERLSSSQMITFMLSFRK
jgi:hypothetical protein